MFDGFMGYYNFLTAKWLNSWTVYDSRLVTIGLEYVILGSRWAFYYFVFVAR